MRRSGIAWKRTGAALLLFAALSMPAGCGREEERAEGDLAMPRAKLSLLSRGDSPFGKSARWWAELVEKRSGGGIGIDVYPAGELLKAGGRSQVDLLLSGRADLALVHPAELLGRVPSLKVLYLPFLFPDFSSARAVLRGEAGRKLLADVEGTGIRGLSFMPGPFLQLFSSDRVVVPDEMEGLRMPPPRRGTGEEIDRVVLSALGVEIANVKREKIREAIESGMVNSFISNPKHFNYLRYRFRMEHATLLNYAFTPMIVCASKDYWSKLTEAERHLVETTLEKAVLHQAELLDEEAEGFLGELVDEGVEVVELIPEEMAKFREAVKGAESSLLVGGAAILDEAGKTLTSSVEPYLYRFWDNVDEAEVTAPPYLPERYPYADAAVLPPAGEGGVAASKSTDALSTWRKALLVPVPSSVAYEVEVPPNPRFTFGFGLRWKVSDSYTEDLRVGDSYPEGVTFYVDVVRDSGKTHRVYSEVVKPPLSRSSKDMWIHPGYGLWIDEKLDLKPFEGERVKIVLSAVPAGAGGGSGHYYEARWSNPVLYGLDPSNNHRNIILISLDTLRSDRLGSYGSERETSPAIDKITEEGTFFADAVSQATWTLPSHMTIMTSLYPFQHGLVDGIRMRELNQSRYTLAELLRDHGYNTAAFTEGGYVGASYGFSHGFNTYSNVHTSYGQKDPFKNPRDLDNIDDMFRGYLRNIQTTFFEASRWIFKHGDRKFFMFLHTYEIHLPYFPNKYVGIFDMGYRGRIGNVMDIDERKELEERGHFSDADLHHIEVLYDAQIRFTDDYVGRLCEYLAELGLERNTLIILTSDHGERLWSRGMLLQHGGDPHEEVLRVPLILRCPSIVLAGAEVTVPVALVDIAPTTCEFAGLKPPSFMEGISLYETAVLGSPLQEGRPLYAEANTSNRTITLRLGDRKVYYNISGDSCRLYDLSTDPDEIVDIGAANRSLTAPYESAVKRFIKSKPVGYFIKFSGNDKERLFEGKLTTEGEFLLVDCYDLTRGKGRFSIDKESLKEITFEISSGEGEEPILAFSTFPENAGVTLDVKMDGKERSERVYLGERMENPPRLPCELTGTSAGATGPSPFSAVQEEGCYVYYVPPDSPKDARPTAMIKLAGTPAGVAVSGSPAAREAEDEREERLEKLKALGYIDD